MLAAALGGCVVEVDEDHHEGFPARDVCLLVREREPNATPRTAQLLAEVFAGDCVVVEGSLFAPLDVDSYRVVVQETLTLVVTLEHSPFVDFDVHLFDADTGQLILDCGIHVVPERCGVPLVVRGFDIAVDVVVTSVSGAGPYTLTLDAR